MSDDLSVLIPWVITHGYFLILLAIIIGGPFVAAIAGAGVALGNFNIYIIIVLAFLGSFLGDLLYFSLGHFSQNLNKFKFFRNLMAKKRTKEIKNLLLKKTVRAIVIIKLLPWGAFLGLIILGSVRVNFFKFIKISALISLLKSIFFVFLGYYSGETYLELKKIITQGQYLGLVVILLVGTIYYLYHKFIRLVSKRIKKIDKE